MNDIQGDIGGEELPKGSLFEGLDSEPEQAAPKVAPEASLKPLVIGEQPKQEEPPALKRQPV